MSGRNHSLLFSNTPNKSLNLIQLTKRYACNNLAMSFDDMPNVRHARPRTWAILHIGIGGSAMFHRRGLPARCALGITRRGVLRAGAFMAAATLLGPPVDAQASDLIPRYEIPAYDGDLPPLPWTWTKQRPPWRTGRGRRR
jgi:hypothetical protein